MKKHLLTLFTFLMMFSSISWGQIISQYIDTNLGTTPKGIEIWNNTSSQLDFNTNNLVIEKGTNGGTPSTDYTLNTGTLDAGKVIVIGTSDMETVTTTNGSVFYLKAFTFNGDDALVVKYGGTTTDIFGDPGTGDPGTGWSGSGVKTYNQNISLLSTITSGDTDGWTNPSTRFETTTTDNSLTGFGIAPSSGSSSSVDAPTSFSVTPNTTTPTSQIDLSWSLNSASNDIIVVFAEGSDVTWTPTDGTSYPVGTVGSDNLIYKGNATSFNHTSLSEGKTYYYKIWSVDGSNNYSNSVGENVTTLKSEPTSHATSFTATANSFSQITVEWTDATGTTAPDGYLVKAAVAPATPSAPSDGTAEGDGTLILNITGGTEQAIFTGLEPTTTYNFSIYPYTNSGSDINYKTNGTVPTATATTEAITGDIYKNITSLSDLEDGGYYVLYGINGTYKGAMSNSISGGRFTATSASIYNNQVIAPDASIIWKLEANGANWNLYNETLSEYANITRTNSTSGFSTSSTPSDFTVSVNSGNYAFMDANGNRGIALYYSDFRTYTSLNTLYLYKKDAPVVTTTTVQFESATATVAENAGTYNISVSITNPDASNATQCEIAFTSGDSTDINNYTTQTITFPAGSSSAITIPLTIIDNADFEGGANCTFEIQNVTGGNSAAVGSRNTFTLTIKEDEEGTFPNAWINEIHYVNNGTDQNEFVEVVLKDASTYNLSELAVYTYNGNGGGTYNSAVLLSAFTEGNTENTPNGSYTFYYYTYPTNGLQNGPDGLALCYNDILIPGQFLSYEGTFTATNGPVVGHTSSDIGVAESNSNDANHSLQLIGTGWDYDNFFWVDPPATPGTLNSSGSALQLFGTPIPVPVNWKYILLSFFAIAGIFVFRKLR